MMDGSVSTSAANSNSSPDCKTLSTLIEGTATDIAINKYSNRYFIVVTQTGSLGTLVSVEKDTASIEKEPAVVYTIKTLLGKDDEEVHIAARFLAEKLDLSKPALFSFCVKDLGPKVLKSLVEVLKANLQ